MDLLETMTTITGFMSYIFDGIIIVTLLIAVITGFRRSSKKSLVGFLIQMFSLAIAIVAGTMTAPNLAERAAEQLNLSMFIPQQFEAMAAPFIEIILGYIIFVAISMFVFTILKSILFICSKSLDLDKRMFSNFHPLSFLDRIISIVFTLLTTYTNLLIPIVIFAFPFLNVVREDSLSGRILNLTPFISAQLQETFQPLTAILEMGSVIESVANGAPINTQELAEQITSNPEAITQMIPLLPEETVAQANEILAEHGMSQGEAIDQLGNMVESGEISQAEIQALLDAHLR